MCIMLKIDFEYIFNKRRPKFLCTKLTLYAFIIFHILNIVYISSLVWTLYKYIKKNSIKNAYRAYIITL